ncbi:pyridoxal phosphate-dependent aminotransferase [Haloarchaeobius sp. DFWS5]|uniref:pyridoxal phosphate-dependent aminotransferase n=1 Tax=Haloarchaeobius sp. DFWS5 TaxID=3446114 RepID=UPI003EBE7BF6
MFPTIDYLQWIAGRPEAATHDLGSSDLRGSFQRQAGAVPGRLAGLEDPPPDRELRAQVADLYDVRPENVLVTAGATSANLLTVATALDEAETSADDDAGDEPQVLVEKPGYEPLLATPDALGARVDRYLRTPETDYQLDPGRVEGAVRSQAALVIMTNRHNPTGTLTPVDTIAAAADAAATEDARLLVDEVYAPYVTDSAGPEGFGGPTAAGVENVVITNSLTKFMGFGGLRIGWLVADADFVAHAERIADHFPVLARPSVELGKRVFANQAELAADRRELLTANHELLASFVADRPDLDGTIPSGSSFALLEHERYDGDELTAAAWEQADLLVVPGRFFDVPEAVRVSLGRDPEDTEAALSAFGDLLDSLA